MRDQRCTEGLEVCGLESMMEVEGCAT